MLSPNIKWVSENIYWYFLHHFANDEHQVKFIEFYQKYPPFLVAPTFGLAVSIEASHHITIGVSDVTNAFQNTIKVYTESDIINFPPHYNTWFKFWFTNILISPSPYGCYAMETCCFMKGNNPYGHRWITILNMVISSMYLINNWIEYSLYVLQRKPDRYVLIVRCLSDKLLCD